MLLEIDRVLDIQLKADLANREYTVSICDLPTRKGNYLLFKAKGLSSGFTWFAGNDEHGNYIEEFLG